MKHSDMVGDTDSDMDMYRNIDMDMHMDLVNDSDDVIYVTAWNHVCTRCAWHWTRKHIWHCECTTCIAPNM